MHGAGELINRMCVTDQFWRAHDTLRRGRKTIVAPQQPTQSKDVGIPFYGKRIGMKQGWNMGCFQMKNDLLTIKIVKFNLISGGIMTKKINSIKKPEVNLDIKSGRNTVF